MSGLWDLLLGAVAALPYLWGVWFVSLRLLEYRPYAQWLWRQFGMAFPPVCAAITFIVMWFWHKVCEVVEAMLKYNASDEKLFNAGENLALAAGYAILVWLLFRKWKKGRKDDDDDDHNKGFRARLVTAQS